MSTLALIISIGLLGILAHRSIAVLLLAPLMAALRILLSGDAGLLLLIHIGSMQPAVATLASGVGHGAVIASLVGFIFLRGAVLGLSPGNPLISDAV